MPTTTARDEQTDTVVAMIVQLGEHDPATLDRDDLSAGLRLLKRVRGWVDATEMSYTRRLQALANHEHDASTSQSLIDDAGHTSKGARNTEARTSLCDRHTGLEASLSTGDITTAHLDAITRCAARLNLAERGDFDARLDEIHTWARTENVEPFERRLKQLVRQIQADHSSSASDELSRQRDQSTMKSWVDSSTGLHKFLWEMDPVRASKFRLAHLSAVNRQRARSRNNKQPWGSVQVDALLDAMTGDHHQADDGSPRVPEIVVLVDDRTLLQGQFGDGGRSVCETVDGSPLPIALVHEMMCEATITLAATNPSGVVRATLQRRTASQRQRIELAAMYSQCAFPNCVVPVSDTRAHHVTFDRHGGATTVPNLLPVCEGHHHSIHDAGWTVSLHPTTRTATWTPPHGGQPLITRPDRRPPIEPSSEDDEERDAVGHGRTDVTHVGHT